MIPHPPHGDTSRVRLWPYALLATLLLIIFAVGVLAPDYLNYRIRLAKIEASKSSVNATTGTNESASSQTVVQSTASAPADVRLAQMEIKSSEIFETYGKLLTMLLGFLSVLGVFFGYFIRKSLREVEDDLRGHVQQNMDFWGKERDRLSNEVSGKLKEMGEQSERLEERSREFEKTVEQSKQLLQTLEAAVKSEEKKLTGDVGWTATAVAVIDADDAIPKLEGK